MDNPQQLMEIEQEVPSLLDLVAQNPVIVELSQSSCGRNSQSSSMRQMYLITQKNKQLTGQIEEIQRQNNQVLEQNKILFEQNKILFEQNKILFEQNKMLFEQNQMLLEQNNELTEKLEEAIKEITVLKQRSFGAMSHQIESKGSSRSTSRKKRQSKPPKRVDDKRKEEAIRKINSMPMPEQRTTLIHEYSNILNVDVATVYRWLRNN